MRLLPCAGELEITASAHSVVQLLFSGVMYNRRIVSTGPHEEMDNDTAYQQ